jgi:hypothetical protein
MIIVQLYDRIIFELFQNYATNHSFMPENVLTIQEFYQVIGLESLLLLIIF